MTSIARVMGALVLLVFAQSAQAQVSLPAARPLEAMVKSSLLSFNDANVTGNYDVFHARLSKPFRAQVSPRDLRAAFKEFADKGIDLDIVTALTPIYDEAPSVDPNGNLLVRGYFATEPTRVHFDMNYIASEGEWRLLRIVVRVAPAPGLAAQN